MSAMPTASQTRSYRPEDCVVFRKTNERFGGLSNMAPGFPLEVNGIRIRSSEALYQACRFPHKPEIQRLIIQQGSPMTAKMKSKPHREGTRADWDAVRVNIMRWCLRVKLAQNWSKFSDLLLATGDRPIVEDSRKDDFWGAIRTDDGTLIGRNILGRLLMELREAVRTSMCEPLRRVEPLNIPQFLLYGKPIGVIVSPGNADGASLGKAVKAIPAQVLSSLSADQESLSATVESSEAADLTAGTTQVNRPQESGVAGIPRECKRLAEVDFPIAEVSKHSAREKDIKQGHPSTLHLWWARRPLGACRAMLMALLLPDPCDPACPSSFKAAARQALARTWQKPVADDESLKNALLRFIGDLANWDLAADSTYLEIARALVKAANPDEVPSVVDPFAGGGSIPLEALRLGCDAFAFDLNPVAIEVLRVCLASVGKHGYSLLKGFKETAEQVAAEAAKTLSAFYPIDSDGTKPLAYFWSRTALCEKPTCGAEIPLLSTLWLSKKPHRRRALRTVVRSAAGATPRIDVEVFEPKNIEEVGAGLVKNARATCPACGSTLIPDRLRAQTIKAHGGLTVEWNSADVRSCGLRLNAVFFERVDGSRDYRAASEGDYTALKRAEDFVRELISSTAEDGVHPIPNEPINPIRPSPNARGLSAVTRYGVATFGQLFTSRQQLALLVFSRIIQSRTATGPMDDDISRLLALTLSKRADYGSVCTRWHLTFEKTTCTFSKQALSNTWDFVEPIPTGSASGSFGAATESVLAALKTLAEPISSSGDVKQADACSTGLPDETCQVWFTDPPYYDAIPYADLSDFFLVWLKRSMPKRLRTWTLDKETGLSPKTEECVWNSSYSVNGKQKDGKFFEEKAAESFREARRILHDRGIGCVVFAHKTTEGWEALLSGMVQSKWVITASWPLATERRGRLQSQNSASLATSVHLVCRPRTEDITGDWGEVLRELPRRVGDWMARLESEGVRGADLVFACIGPALEIFSRYSRVETPDGTEKTLAEYLEKVWEVVGRVALEQILGTPEAQARNGAAGALEEDARLTALFLWTLQSTDGEAEGSGDEHEDEDSSEDEEEETGPSKKKPGFTLIYDVARRFAQPLGIHLSEWEGRIIETKKGVVRLLPVRERSQQLFGEAGADLAAERIEKVARGAEQLDLFSAAGLVEACVPEVAPKRGRKKGGVADDALKTRREATTLDRVHAAMLLQASGRANALRSLLKSETERSPDFLRLANSLSALYPKECEEKRLLDAMLLAAPR